VREVVVPLRFHAPQRKVGRTLGARLVSGPAIDRNGRPEMLRIHDEKMNTGKREENENCEIEIEKKNAQELQWCSGCYKEDVQKHCVFVRPPSPLPPPLRIKVDRHGAVGRAM
jgi:hypothetical protein